MLAVEAGSDLAVGGEEDEPDADQGGGGGFGDGFCCRFADEEAPMGIDSFEAATGTNPCFSDTDTR